MRLSELSDRGGVSVATVKYYLREGLLAPGTPVTARQSDYGEEHLRRLRLIRALLTVGGMTIQQARDVLAVADDPAFGRHERVGIAAYMLGPQISPPDASDPERALWDEVFAEMRDLLTEMGWYVNEEAPALAALTRAVVTLRSLGYRGGVDDIRRYAEVMHPIAAEEYTVMEEYPVLEEAIEAAVAYTMLYEPILLALRRLAHEDVSAHLYGISPPNPPLSSP
ncbi:MerR family transcriptional regulator [Streptomyces sp. NBC_01353]|uniref:MerR family transcriptional regulator n=1 Tax=Streptomyces sp. NBC_01353 TaxID=2903835 RepID=UPI002E2F7FDB|nr:MerR family transcriptional regulator [Streptomyces sp. NBC_01353]